MQCKLSLPSTDNIFLHSSSAMKAAPSQIKTFIVALSKATGCTIMTIMGGPDPCQNGKISSYGCICCLISLRNVLMWICYADFMLVKTCRGEHLGRFFRITRRRTWRPSHNFFDLSIVRTFIYIFNIPLTSP